IKQVVIKSTIGGVCRIRSSRPIKPSGLSYRQAKGKNPNLFFNYIYPGIPLTGEHDLPMDRDQNLPMAEVDRLGISSFTEQVSSIIEFDTVRGEEYECR